MTLKPGMDVTIPTTDGNAKGAPLDRFLSLLSSFGTARLIAMGTVALSLIGFFAVITMRMSEPEMGLLYGDLDMADSGRIVERLNDMEVPYRLEDGGRTIYAPSESISDLRVTLAGEGLSGNVVGWEIFDRAEGLGTTSFVQNINRLRAIEGELARTIREITTVQAARVHIVLPERQLFSRAERKPTASIVLRTTGIGLDKNQVAAIQYLVSAAVPDLSPQNISIVDQSGTLLARSGQGLGEGVLLGGLEDKRRKLEDYYRSRVEQLLEKTVGIGRVRAQIAVTLGMNEITTNQELYDPDSQVVRSTRTVEESDSDQENQPDTVSVGNDLPDAQQPAPAGPLSISRSDREEETVNYEISRTVRTEVKGRGGLERISAAVVVDGTYRTGANGERVYSPRSEADIEQLAALVRSAIGYDANRGDTVEVANMPFAEPEILDGVDTDHAVFLGLTKHDIYALAEMTVYGVVAIFVLLLVVRPLVNRLIGSMPEPATAGGPALEGPGDRPALPGPDRRALEEAAANGDSQAIAQLQGEAGIAALSGPDDGDDAEIDVAHVDGKLKESSIKKVGEIVNSHPEEAAAIVRNWLYSE